ncbi:phosphomannomutase/phosphoglucomutase [uncultured Desulfobulbus sp.]|uniref:phosphomannomutase/phosphoglucomutase n=1 Tax=uncultured Desulfobulbus sp. TaxID=239745 RepID=UPI0029C7D3DE|nr:phosphomannomutase/phosphoglucomutase [uncultured Desulfobulbus sp.]
MKKMSIYKACDIRGIYGTDLTDNDAYLIGRAMGAILSSKDVVVGGDVRISTPALKEALIKGLLASGSNVVDVGIVPTPVYYYAKSLLNIEAGVMVTASHNPPKFNGFKPALGSLPITEAEIQNILSIVREGSFPDDIGVLKTYDIIPEYLKYIASISPKPSNAGTLKVVVDCGNGCFSEIAPSILKNVGYITESLFCVPDGSFPNRSPNSAVAANLKVLTSTVVESGADLGVAFDGDGDRVSFIDSKGRMLSADKCIVVLAGMMLADNPGGKIVYDLKCSSIVPESVSRAGGIPLAERSGHTFIKTRMIRDEGLFGGEISGHYFYKELHGGDDGLYTALKLAGYLAETGLPLSDLADSIPEYAITPDIRLPYDGDRKAVIEKIAAGFPDEMVSRIDGVKINFTNGWGLARISVTEPVITLRFEAAKPDLLVDIINEFLAPVPEISDSVIKEAGL